MASRRVLITGAGIAGPTLAYWLDRYGMEPTVLERAPELRLGGQNVDVRGAGRVVVAPGAKPFLYFGVLATCDPGDEVNLHEPSYVAYVPAIVFAGGTQIEVVTPGPAPLGQLRIRVSAEPQCGFTAAAGGYQLFSRDAGGGGPMRARASTRSRA